MNCQTIIPNKAENIKNIFSKIWKLIEKTALLCQKIKKWKKFLNY